MKLRVMTTNSIPTLNANGSEWSKDTNYSTEMGLPHSFVETLSKEQTRSTR